MKVADPQPGFCSRCYGAHPELRYVDFEVGFDGEPVLDKESGTIAILPNGQMAVHDSLYLCENCVREAHETLELNKRSEVLTNLYREKERERLAKEHWMSYAKRLEQSLGSRPEIEVPRRGRPPARKVAA